MAYVTYKEWTGDLDDCLKVGDEVDEEIANYFLCVLPPIQRNGVLQIGEPYSHVNGRPTFATLRGSFGGRWFYCGNCHAGQSEEPKERILA